jgi:hypothetical protein
MRWFLTTMVLCWLTAGPCHAFYNPEKGRWLSRDPIAERGSILLRDPAYYSSSGPDPILGVDLRAIEHRATEDAWSREDIQPYAFNKNDGIDFVDRLRLMRIQDLLAKLQARKQANANNRALFCLAQVDEGLTLTKRSPAQR